jgi:Spy/CpxP family protein refolding chaperone
MTERITEEHAKALIALHKAEAEGAERRTLSELRQEVAKHEAKARRAALTPEQRAKLEQVEQGIGELLAHTYAVDAGKGRVHFVIDPEYLHLTFKK